MKTPWSSLLQYGVGIAAVIVIAFAAIGLMIVVGVAVLLAKVAVFVK